MKASRHRLHFLLTHTSRVRVRVRVSARTRVRARVRSGARERVRVKVRARVLTKVGTLSELQHIFNNIQSFIIKF